MAKITPAAKPTEILAKFCTDQGAANRNRPINAKGTLFKDPTKEYMVGVVVEINQREVKLMAKPRRPLKSATAKKDGLCKSGSFQIVCTSPVKSIIPAIKGKERRLL